MAFAEQQRAPLPVNYTAIVTVSHKLWARRLFCSQLAVRCGIYRSQQFEMSLSKIALSDLVTDQL